jgi:hypothetical protein
LLRSGFLDEIIIGAGKSRQPIDHWYFAARFGIRGQINRKNHVAAQYAGVVFEFDLFAAEYTIGTNLFKTHGYHSLEIKKGQKYF